MNRRGFLGSVLGGLAFLLGKGLFQQGDKGPTRGLSPFLIQVSPIAGLYYHEAGEVWEELAEGDSLELVREPANPYDWKAVAVYWKGYKLGYLPRRENMAVAQMMDRGYQLVGRLARKEGAVDLGIPRQGLWMEVWGVTLNQPSPLKVVG